MKKVSFVITACFVLFVCCFSVISIVAKDEQFSQNENRYLATAPKFSFSSIFSGDFQSELENYLNDHIVWRERLITLKTGIQKSTGNTDIGGAYIGKDGYCFEKITKEDVDDKLVNRNTKSLVQFFDSASKDFGADHLSFLLVPTSSLVLEDKLPKNARQFSQSEYMDNIQAAVSNYNVVDVRDCFAEHKNDYIYYRTDHHWTSDGAYLAYSAWQNSMGKSTTDKTMLKKHTVTDSFKGSLYSKILNADSAKDSIWIYSNSDDYAAEYADNYKVTLEDNKQGRVLNAEKLLEKDKYLYFFGGNYGTVKIEHIGDREKTGKNILIIKDSFANTFAPFVLNEYDNVYMLDLRYFKGDVLKFANDNQVKDILVLYNISNFISDKNLFKLNGGFTK